MVNPGSLKLPHPDRFATMTTQPFCRFLIATCLAFLSLSGSASKSYAEVPGSKNEPPECYALLVGINSYSTSKLSGCENDSRAIKKVLVDNYGFPDDKQHIKELYNQVATKQAILDAFKSQLIDNAKRLKKEGKEGIFVFQFSGHGSQVPDISGDEPDGRDETICPVDVILNDPKNDILDDEIESLVRQVTDYSDNLTLIMDCCHSGSNSRADEFVARRLERPLLFERAKTRGDKEPAAKLLLPPNRRYVAMAGCMADELSLETKTEGVDHGLMTSALVNVLSASNTKMTYQDLWTKVAAKVNKSASSQHPVFEGDLSRDIFGGASSRGMPSLKVIKDDEDDGVQINAGTASGVEKGGIVAFYKKGIHKLAGNEGMITLGTVTEASDFTSTVKLAQPPGNDVVMAQAQVVPVTPFFGRKKLAVKLQAPSPSKLSLNGVANAPVFEKLMKSLKLNDALICSETTSDPLAESHKEWAVAVVEKTDSDFVLAGGKLSHSDSTRCDTANKGAPAESQKGYFIATKEGCPLYNLFVPLDTVNGDEILLNALLNKNRQEALRTFSNSCSDLSNDVIVRIQRMVSKTPIPGTTKFDYQYQDVEVDNLTIPTFKSGERFRLAITNKSKVDLYVSGLCAATSGAIDVAFPPHGAGDKLEKGRTYFTPGFEVEGISGIETLLIVFTTSPVDYAPLSQESAALAALKRSQRDGTKFNDTQRDNTQSSGVRDMLTQAMYNPGATSRDSAPDVLPPLDDWCTKRIDYKVISTP